MAEKPISNEEGVVVVGGRADVSELVAAELATVLGGVTARAQLPQAAARLATRPGVPGWRRELERQVARLLTALVARLWQEGWQPADLVRVTRRKLDEPHLSLLRYLIAAQLQPFAGQTLDPAWPAQLSEHGIVVTWRANEPYLRAWSEHRSVPLDAVVLTALQVAELLGSLPRLELLGPLPGTARPSGGSVEQVDQRMLERVRALLAKAESTTFPAEAETFTAGAQALMARHSIDVAMVQDASRATGGRDRPGGCRIGIENPYESGKALLLEVVARANRCRSVWSKELGFSSVVGFPADLAAVELLFTSLLVQATTAMTREGSQVDGWGRSSTRSFRSAFLASYATRIGERLTEATTAATADAVREEAAERGSAGEAASVAGIGRTGSEGGSRLLPVLAARGEEVDAEVDRMFPRMRLHRGSRLTNRAGWMSGRAAADRAALQSGPALPGAASR